MHQGVPHEPRYGFGQGIADNFNPFASYVDQQGMPITISDEAMRAAMGFVPVAGTIHNWVHMEPWERGLSMGLDAIDIATLGGGKAITAPIKATTKFITKGAPALTFLRAGDMPTTQAGEGFSGWNYPDYATYFDKQLPSHTDFMPSFNHAAYQPEEGISVFQSLKFPWDVSQGPNIFMRPAQTPGGLKTQVKMWNMGELFRPFYEVSGDPLKAVGGDLETLLDPASVNYLQKIAPPNPPTFLSHRPTTQGFPQVSFDVPGYVRQVKEPGWRGADEIINPNTGETINLTKEFAKYNLSGQYANPFLRLDDIIGSNINRATLHPALPVSFPGRIPMQLYDNEANINQSPIAVLNRTGSIRDATYG